MQWPEHGSDLHPIRPAGWPRRAEESVVVFGEAEMLGLLGGYR